MARRAALLFPLVLMMLSDLRVVWPQESATYSMKRLTVTSGAGQAASAQFGVVLTLGQTEPAGSVSFCNSGFGAALGFWSGVGEVPVPNLLTLAWDAPDRRRLDLTWSGTAQRFEIYRGGSAAALFQPGNLFATETHCVSFDDEPLTGAIYYYGVLPAGN